MSVTEHLMRPGNGTLSFKPTVPLSITQQIAEFVDEQQGGSGAHIVICPVRLDPGAVGLGAILGSALYSGAITGRPARTSIEFAGLSSWLDTYIYKASDTGIHLGVSGTTGTPTEWMNALVGNGTANGSVNGLSVGTAAQGGSNVVRSFLNYTTTHREALDLVAALGGWEYEVRPDFTVDYGLAANLFREAGDDQTVVVTARAEGPDGTLRGIEGGLIDQKLSQLGPLIATDQVALGAGIGETVEVGTATTSRNLQTWDGDAPVLRRVFSTPTESNLSSAATNVLNLGGMRRKLAVSSTTTGARRFIRPGDECFVFDLESGLFVSTSPVVFRGETIAPITARLLSMTWPIEADFGVYVFSNEASPTVLDVSDWVASEAPSATWTVGDWKPETYGTQNGVLVANRSDPIVESRLADVGKIHLVEASSNEMLTLQESATATRPFLAIYGGTDGGRKMYVGYPDVSDDEVRVVADDGDLLLQSVTGDVLLNDGYWGNVSALPTPWTNITTWANSWTSYGGSWQVPQYRKHMDTVEIRGLAGNTTTQGTLGTIFTLPIGYRPPAQMIVSAQASLVDGQGSGNDIQTRLTIYPTGIVRCEGTVDAGNSWISFNHRFSEAS